MVATAVQVVAVWQAEQEQPIKGSQAARTAQAMFPLAVAVLVLSAHHQQVLAVLACLVPLQERRLLVLAAAAVVAMRRLVVRQEVAVVAKVLERIVPPQTAQIIQAAVLAGLAVRT